MDRIPRIFFSAGEPSGDLHGANLIRALERISPGVRCEGFGGERMQEAGCQLHFPLCQFSLFGLYQVVLNIGHFVRLLRQATAHFTEQRPDAVVLIDYPGFNWWVARRARAAGIPVFYFVPPQIWAWAGWRVRKMRRHVDHVLCTLPFERPWYQARGIDAPYIGHPYFDALHEQTLDDRFRAAQLSRPGRLIALLPGSRRQEIEYNLASQLRAAALIHRRCPDTRFLVACFKREHAEHAAAQLCEMFPAPGRLETGSLDLGLRGSWSLPVELCVGRTPEIIDLAHSCIAVSGSVSMELLFACKPSVILYRGAATLYLAWCLLCKVRHICLVNLLAEKKLYPEFVSVRCQAAPISEHIVNWLEDSAAHDRLRGELGTIRDQVARPGACDRAADYILSALGSNLITSAA